MKGKGMERRGHQREIKRKERGVKTEEKGWRCRLNDACVSIVY